MAQIRGDLKLAILTAVNGHFLFEDDEDMDEDPNILEKVEDFAEQTVPNFMDRQFQQHFRMCPNTFEDLLQKLSFVSDRVVSPGRFPIPLEKQTMITLWCLSNLESFRSVADRFGVTMSTCWEVLYRMCHKILKINETFQIISWPTGERALAITQSFQRITGFEGVLGCIDGSHIKILPPKNHPNSYSNRKRFHSILLQGVCDNKKLFTHVYAGEPGSIHDNRLFEKSDLFTGIEAGELNFPHNSNIIGDLAYKLRSYLLVGFKNSGNLTNIQKNFNLKLSQTRAVIENAFALLKGRFRRLKYMETKRLDLIALLIVSASILHNVCILNGDDISEIINIDEELEKERGLNDEVVYGLGQDHQLAVTKRLRIMNRLELDQQFN